MRGVRAAAFRSLGKSVVKEMNRLGMMVDLAHITPKGAQDVLELSELPVMHSHGCVRAINPTHPRTWDDYQLEALAAKDGLFCVTTVPDGLLPNRNEATIDTVLDHVEHAVKIMGSEHVGLGADFDVYQSHLGLPEDRWTTGLEEADRWPRLTAGFVGARAQRNRCARYYGREFAAPLPQSDRLTRKVRLMLVVEADRLIDGTGAAPRIGMRLLIENGRIVDVVERDATAIPEGATVIDARSSEAPLTVMPGMIDAHVHVMWAGEDTDLPLGSKDDLVTEMPGMRALRAYDHAWRDLRAGFTTLRDVHCLDFVDISLRDAISQGVVDGPRISAGGYGLTATGGHMDDTNGMRPDVRLGGFNNVVDTPDEARRAVRYLVKMGADHIKINAGRGYRVRGRQVYFAPEMRADVLQTICQEAHEAGRRVAAHSLGSQGELWAVQAGVDSLEHAHFASDELLQAMAEHGTYLVPTMTHCVRNANKLRASLPPDQLADNLILMAYDSMYRVIPKAIKLGIPIATGTDAGAFGVPHGCNAMELELLVTAGLSPMQAIEAATHRAAMLLDMDHWTGTLEKGKFADLLVVHGDPLQDIALLQQPSNIALVMKEGKVVHENANRQATGLTCARADYIEEPRMNGQNVLSPATDPGRGFPHVLPMRRRAEIIHQLVKGRLATLLPQAMAAADLDMWILLCQEDNLDPVFASLIPMDTWCPILQMLVFVKQPDGSVEGVNICGTNTHDLYRRLYSGQIESEQWPLLAQLVTEHNPQRIGINIGSVAWSGGGLTYNLYQQLVQQLPQPFTERLVSAEPAATLLLSTLTDEELVLYEHVIQVAHAIMGEVYSRDVIIPGETTVRDLEWAYWQRCADLGFTLGFKPSYRLIRSDAQRAQYGADDIVIRPGDGIHCDVGLYYLRLNSDHQQIAYVLRPGEDEAPAGLRALMASANRLQDIYLDEFRLGLTGNELLHNMLTRARREGIPNPKVYSHNVGIFVHEPGPLIGLPWEQDRCEGRGDVKLSYNQCFTMELSITDRVPEWGDQEVRMPLEEDVVFTPDGCRPLDGRQTSFYLI